VHSNPTSLDLDAADLEIEQFRVIGKGNKDRLKKSFDVSPLQSRPSMTRRGFPA